MQLIRTTKEEIGWATLNYKIKAGEFRKGDEIEINGSLWRVLDIEENGIFIWKHSGPGEDIVFNENGLNKYEGSDIQKYAREEFPATLPKSLTELVTEDGFNPLSIAEIRRYLPTEGERIVTDENGDTIWWWSRSASRGNTHYAWLVYASGNAITNLANGANRFAPACHLKGI